MHVAGVPFTQFHQTLESAIGYLELGMAEEALRELDTLPQADQAEEDVLELRLMLNQHVGCWEGAAAAAEALCRIRDADADRYITWGCCLSEMGRHEECRRALDLAPPEARTDALWNYHRAHCEALLGNTESARQLVHQSLRIDPTVRALAEGNTHLNPLL
jgi:tetratricopeptide (TPR) repeat protein